MVRAGLLRRFTINFFCFNTRWVAFLALRTIDLETGALVAFTVATPDGTAGALTEATAVAAIIGLAEVRERPTIKLVTNIFINTVYASTGKNAQNPPYDGLRDAKSNSKTALFLYFSIA